MKSNGSRYVVIAFGVIVAYVVYQIWFNETRKIQRQLGGIAAALSAPAAESPFDRIARVARLRRYLADDIRVRAGTASEIISRDALLTVLGGWTPPDAGVDVQFVDVQIKIDRATRESAQAMLTVEVNGRDSRTGQPTRETADAMATLARRNGEWLVTSAESKARPPDPSGR